MDRETRNAIERATQRARGLLEDDFSAQLDGDFDIRPSGEIARTGGPHLPPRQHVQRERIVAAIQHKRAAGMSAAEAVADYVRDAAFTTLNRFAALKMLEARELVQQCVSRGEESSGYRELQGLAPGVALLPDGAGYRLYIECLFDELSTEVKVLFDRRDPASVLWPRRAAFEGLLELLNAPELSGVWGEDETIGWVYQYFNSQDERRAMREASQAPRNSRELAVRNQFFTPRYVVQFLVDNTLARTWLEMMGDATRLPERCDYLVREGTELRPRSKKDPRDFKILDPACGSGHFLLYAFDLLLQIYEEAWHDPKAPHAIGRRTLREDYPDFDGLRRTVPALIIEENLYGVDIDPRPAQIAALALWMRAQRAWKDLDVPRDARPRLRRTNIVVAEPMPGDAALVEEFAARLDPPLLGDLFQKMVAEMRLAGELGTLLRVEEAIAEEVSRAREAWIARRAEQPSLPGLEPTQEQKELDLSGIDDDRFFHEAEERIIETLREYAESAGGAASVQRRLFAGDAAQGIAFIDLLRARFDVVLMNPPFGAPSLAAKKEFERSYPRTKGDIFAAFVERGVRLLQPRGLVGAITSRTGFFLSSFQKWREEVLLKEAPPIVVADLGHGVMDAAMVEAAAYCLQKATEVIGKALFIRALLAGDKGALLRRAATALLPSSGRERFEIDLATFKSIPSSPFAYWVSDRFRDLFTQLLPLEFGGRVARRGVNTNDDERFLRLTWECSGPGWEKHVKGGAWSPYYSDPHVLLKWGHDGEELQAERVTDRVYKSAIVPSRDLYFRPGLTWSRRTTSRLSLRAMPSNCVFGDKGPAVILSDDNRQDLLAILAVTNSEAFISCVELQLAAADAAARSYEVGVIQRTPLPCIQAEDGAALAELARRAWSLKRQLDTANENSHAFTLPAALQADGQTLSDRAGAWASCERVAEPELTAIQAEIDSRCFDLYGIAQPDRQPITESSCADDDAGSAAGEPEDELSDDTDEDATESSCDNLPTLIADLVSWAVGVALGRFDVRFAIGARSIPAEPEPFDPLPVCSPGILADGDGLPIVVPPPEYPVRFPVDGLLVDDPGHPNDLPAAIRRVFELVFAESSDARWTEAATLLDPAGHDLRRWLSSEFFDSHLRRYSKSRRKAPIYCQVATPSRRYSLWLYAHHLTRDTLFHIQQELLGPKLSHEEHRLLSLIQEAGPNPTASQRKSLADQQAFVEELRIMRDEVARVAPLWNPDLDDGVAITMAPLWRLVPQHRAWQRELQSTWEALAAGKYDWAHLAMHLWPERVVPKCAEDRSLAIAHGLEDVFWEENSDGRWKRRLSPSRSIEELVRERTSLAVKDALKSLMEAPAPGGGGRATRSRRGRAVGGR